MAAPLPVGSFRKGLWELPCLRDGLVTYTFNGREGGRPLEFETFSAFISYLGSSNWIFFLLFLKLLKLLNKKRKLPVIYAGRSFIFFLSSDQKMCFETMERTKYEKGIISGSKFRWSPFFDHAEDEGLKPGRTNRRKTTTRGCLRRKEKRARLVKIAKTTTETTEETVKSSYERRPSEACGYPRHPGAMAPPNTTQYIMDGVCQDIKMDAQSTQDGLLAEFDSFSENCLYFQQKDFEELFSTNLE